MEVENYIQQAVLNLNNVYCDGRIEYEFKYGYQGMSYFLNIYHLNICIYRERLLASESEANKALFDDRIKFNIMQAGIVKMSEMIKNMPNP